MTILKATTTIEVERVRLQNYAVDSIARVGTVALRHSTAALRLGHDPVQAARDVFTGNPAIGQRGVGETVARALATSYLLGLRRTALAVRQHYGHEVLTLSRSDDKLSEWLLLLIGVSAIAETEISALFARARSAASTIVQRMTAPLLRRVAAVADAVARSGVVAAQLPALDLPIADVGGYVPSIPLYDPPVYRPTVRVVTKELATQFAKAGFVPGAEHGITNSLGVGMVGAYESGRARGWRMPAIQEKLWGLHYSAVLDDRTTNLCRGLDGTVLPLADPFWQQWTPPNHFGCRSAVIEVWQSSRLREPPADLRTYQQFGNDFFIG